MLSGLIQAAREQLPHVSITSEQLQALIQTAISLGVEGNRVDIFTVRAAIASAALAQRSDVEEEDMKLAIKLVLIPPSYPHARQGSFSRRDAPSGRAS